MVFIAKQNKNPSLIACGQMQKALHLSGGGVDREGHGMAGILEVEGGGGVEVRGGVEGLDGLGGDGRLGGVGGGGGVGPGPSQRALPFPAAPRGLQDCLRKQ